MKNQWYAVAAVVTLAPLALVAIPRQETQSAESSAAQRKVEERSARTAEVQARAAGALAGMEKQHAIELSEAMRDLESEHLGRLAEEMGPQAWSDDGETVQIWSDDGSGWLGVSIVEMNAEKAKELKLPAERGVLITDVEAESPAGKAGLKSGDVITEFNGQRIEGTVQFRRLVRETPPNRTVALNMWRDGKTQTISVTLGSREIRGHGGIQLFGPEGKEFHFEMPEVRAYAEAFSGFRTPLLGINAEELSGQLGEYFGAPGGEGILIKEVKSGTPAEKSGMKAGDVITKVAGQRVKTLSELRTALRDHREEKAIPLTVLRKGAEVSLSVELEQPRKPERKTISRRIVL